MLIHRNRNTRTMVALLLLGLMWSVPAVAYDEEACEVPLFVKQNSGGANIMILADNSLSMNAAVYHPDYIHAIKWSGYFIGGRTYYVSKDGSYSPASFYYRWARSPVVNLVNSDNGQSGWYDGNYLNWLFYHATDAQRATVPTVTRIQVLKTVLDQIIERSQQLDVGLTVYNYYNNGGTVIGGCGTDKDYLRQQIAKITANTYTPIGEALETVLDYFGDKNVSPITSSCDNNFVLVVTDGLPTRDVGVSNYLHDADGDGKDPGNCDSIGAPYSNSLDCSDHLDDVAYWMAHNDVNPHVEDDQFVYTYVVGYNEYGPLLKDTAENGNGLYFEADNAVELLNSIEYALQDILRRISAGSAVAVVSTERGTDDRLYRGKFMPLDWTGFLECYQLPYEDGDRPVWEAGSILKNRNPSSRNIFTALNSQEITFSPGSASTLWRAMSAVNEEEAANLITWGQGYDVDGYRDRQGWVLGDIIHSTPIVVGPPSDFIMDENYEAFRAAHEYRDKTVYVGANDGMVHSFNAETGQENWAFVPEFSLPKFAAMADSFYCHNYTCDQTLKVKDIKVNGAWRTVIVAGGGKGGSGIFAMDVTYPTNPSVLWQADLPNGLTDHSEVEIVSIAGKSMVLVGSGLDTGNMEAYLYAFDMSTGDLLGSKMLSVDNTALRNRASRPAVVDVNMDGETDLIYMADMLGHVYRISTHSGYNPAGWDVSTLYDGKQEIQADPVASFGPNGAIYVYFGTGAYIEDPDMTSDNQNSFVCVYDNHSGSTATMNELANQTSSIGDIGGYMGWYVDLWNVERERVTQQAVVVAETVIFTSFAPNSDACVAGGTSWVYQMNYEDGGIPDVDFMEDEGDRSANLGDGIASYPVVDLSEGTVVVQNSDASIHVVPIAGIIERLRVRSWQENYDHVKSPAQTAGADGVQ